MYFTVFYCCCMFLLTVFFVLLSLFLINIFYEYVKQEDHKDSEVSSKYIPILLEQY